MAFKVGWRILVLIVVVGVCIGLVTGLVERPPGYTSIPEVRYFGVPLVWRSTDPFVGEKYHYFELIVDCAFWMAIALVAALLVKVLVRRGEKVS